MSYYAIVRREQDESLSVSLSKTPPPDPIYCRVSPPLEDTKAFEMLQKIERDFEQKGNWYQTYDNQIPRRNPIVTKDDIQNLKQTVEPRTSVLNFSSQEMQSNKNFTDKLTADLGNKSAAERRSNDWREADEQRVQVIQVIGKGINKASIGDVKKDIKNIRTQKVKNTDINMSVIIGKKGLNDSLHYAIKYHDPITANALYSVNTLIKNSVLLDTVTLKAGENKNKEKSTVAMHELYSPFVFKGKPYIAKIAVECSIANGNFKNQLYNLQSLKVFDLSDIKKSTSAQPVLPFSQNENSGHEQNNVDSISISQLFEYVKTFDKNFYTNSEKFQSAREDVIVENNQNQRFQQEVYSHQEVYGDKIVDTAEFTALLEQKKIDTKEILKKLEDGVSEIYTSVKYQQYLTTMSKFHNYSPNNTLMIYMQNPTAFLVAGFEDWNKKFERRVEKGEKGISILAPCTRKEPVVDENGKPVLDVNGEQKTQTRITHYRKVSVFDVSQTSGKELPEIAQKLTGDVKDFNRLYSALRTASPVPIETENIVGGANGYFSHTENRIVIHAELSEEQTLKTAIHEIAHAILHNKTDGEEQNADRKTRELQAESIAYTVCQRLGIDSSDYSFGYIASWSADKTGKQLKDNLDVIKRTADQIIGNVEQTLERVKIEREERERLELERKAQEITQEISQQQTKTQSSQPIQQTAQQNNIAPQPTTQKQTQSGTPKNGGTVKYSDIENKKYINTVTYEATQKLAVLLKKANIGYSFAMKYNGKYSVTVEQENFNKALNIHKSLMPKMSFDEILSRFSNVKQLNSHQFVANCPCCNDTKQHLYIKLDTQSNPQSDLVLLNCRKNDCTSSDITSAVGLKMSDLFTENSSVSNDENSNKNNLAETKKILPTERQIACLGNGGTVTDEKGETTYNGFGFKNVENWTFDEASEIIEILEKNNWHIPTGINPQNYITDSLKTQLIKQSKANELPREQSETVIPDSEAEVTVAYTPRTPQNNVTQPSEPPVDHGKVIQWRNYIYFDINHLALQKSVAVQEDGHKFAVWKHQDFDGKWVNGLAGAKPQLYNIGVRSAQKIYIVEDEKDVETMQKMGLACVCSPHGSKWSNDFAQYFYDKDVVVITDNDIPGKKYGDLITDNIGDTAKSLKVIPAVTLLTGLKEGGDISDITEIVGESKTRDLIFEKEREAVLPMPSPFGRINLDEIRVEDYDIPEDLNYSHDNEEWER